MRFLGYSVGDDSIPMGPPSPELMAQMGQFMDEMTKNGKLVATGAFAPIATGTTKVSLTDGESSLSFRCDVIDSCANLRFDAAFEYRRTAQ